MWGMGDLQEFLEALSEDIKNTDTGNRKSYNEKHDTQLKTLKPNCFPKTSGFLLWDFMSIIINKPGLGVPVH